MEQWTRAAAFYERVLQPITWAELSDPKSALYQSLEALFRVLVVDSAFRKSAKLHNLRRHFLQDMMLRGSIQEFDCEAEEHMHAGIREDYRHTRKQTASAGIAKREQIRQALQWAPAGLAETLSRFPHLAVLYGATEVKHRQLGSVWRKKTEVENADQKLELIAVQARGQVRGSWQQGVMGSDHHYIMLDDPMMMALFDGSVFYLRLIDVLLPSSATTDRKPWLVVRQFLRLEDSERKRLTVAKWPWPQSADVGRQEIFKEDPNLRAIQVCAETFRQMTQARMQHDCVHAHCRFVRKEGNCFEKQHSRVNLWILQPRRLSPGDFTQ
ncbi:hypothetical protein PAPYR_2737 [Paratrimastix pyriformis]|nr:hypothetical protein PAPYR_2737 [Paratrimastix pyriformis]